MQSRRFFDFLERYNALVIALAGTLAVILLFFGAATLLKDFFSTRYVSRTVKLADNDNASEIKETFALGSPAKIRGTVFSLVPLETKQEYSAISSGKFSSYSKEATAMRNLLFINGSSGASSWLLANNKSLICNYQLFAGPLPEGKSEPKPTVAVIYKIVNADTNGNGRLDCGDKSTLSASKPDGSGYKEILTGIDEDRSEYGNDAADDKGMFLIFEKDGAQHYAVLQFPDFKLRFDHIVKIPN